MGTHLLKIRIKMVFKRQLPLTMVKSGLKKFLLKSLHTRICDFGHSNEVRKSSLPHGGISKKNFLDHFSPSFLGQNFYFGIQIPF